MKSVLISIQPKWCEKIASGEKTIEVRKSRPKLETPFKCYIYETKGYDTLFGKGKPKKLCVGGGRVIGEFVCDRVFNIPFTKPFLYYGKKMFHSNNCCKEACLSYIELEDYLGNKDGYGWHIYDLKIYDKPKELGEFRKPCKFAYSSYEEGICYEDCIQGKLEDCRNFCLPITRPPQSWCYVESLGE